MAEGVTDLCKDNMLPIDEQNALSLTLPGTTEILGNYESVRVNIGKSWPSCRSVSRFGGIVLL